MSPTLALHLGAHKTATTYIQRNLDDRRRELLRHGVRYFGSAELRGVEGVVFPTPRDVREDLAAPVQRRTRAMLSRMVDAAVPDDAARVLVSEENILGSSRLNLRRAKLYPALAERLACLPESWGAGRTEIYLSVRNYADFFASCHSTIALQGDWIDLGADRQARIAELPRRWTDIVAEIRAHFPAAELVVWRYEDLGRVGQEVMDSMVGAPFPMDFGVRGTMASLTAEGMEAIEAAFIANGEAPLSPETVRRIRDETQGSGARYDPWDPALRARLTEAYEADWAEISALNA